MKIFLAILFYASADMTGVPDIETIYLHNSTLDNCRIAAHTHAQILRETDAGYICLEIPANQLPHLTKETF